MRKAGWFAGLVMIAGLLLAGMGCGGGSAEGSILRVDAEYDPDLSVDADAPRPVSEATPAVAQTFTVEQSGRLEEFWIMVTDGESLDAGVIRVTVQPVDGGGIIDPDVADSLIDPILINTATLPALLVRQFTQFDIGNEPGRDVLAGERYAIVVEFVSRATNVDANAIARVLGVQANPYAGGNGATGELEVGFVNNTEDAIFRTFVLTES